MKMIEPQWDNGKNDEEIVSWIENKTQHCFPGEYKNIVYLYDGLCPKKNIFEFIDFYGHKDERDITFLSYQPQATKYSVEGYYIPMEHYQKGVSDPLYYGVSGLVAFGECANGDSICFDYREDRQTCNPKVVLVYHDDYVEQDNGIKQMVVNFVADSFEEFIDMLHE